MSKSTYGLRKAGLATLATTLVMGAGIAGAGSASATSDFKFDRIGGADRYETSALVADEYAATNTDAILANGEPGNYADALSANTLAGELGAPVLLTKKDKTPDSILKQLADDGVKKIYVVGGEGVVSAAQVASLESKGYTVERISGDDRFGTNAKIIAKNGAAKGNTGLIATGFNFPDALAAGPVSYQGHPLGLSTKDSIDDEVVSALKAAGVTKVLIFGGTTVVTPAVEAKLAANGITTEKRFAGEDRADTSEQAAEYALASLGFTNTHLGVASGYINGYGADALAGGPLEGKEKSPMLVTRDVNNPDDVTDYIKKHANTLATGHIYGGNAAISTAAETEMSNAAKSTTTNQSFTVSPQTAETLTFTANPDTTTTDDRQFTVTGLDNTKSYNLALVPGDEVTVAANGAATFGDNEGAANQADNVGDQSVAQITVVNGSDIVDTGQTEVSPVGGSISFTIDGAGTGDVVPVVYLDANNNNQLDLDAADKPTEQFGLGGKTTYLPAEADGGAIAANQAITRVDKTNNSIVAGGKTYFYDANDTFQIGGAPVTLAEFEQQLSTGDDLDGNTYASNPELSSSFNLDDKSPDSPNNVLAEVVSDTSIKVTWTAPSTGAPDNYRVYRAADTTPSTCSATLSDYALVTTVGGTTLTHTDTGLAPSTGYCYLVTAVKDGDESKVDATTAGSEATDDKDGETTAAAGVTAAPQSTDAGVTTDGGFSGIMTAGDTWQIGFSRVMATPDATDVIRVQDSNGESVDVTCAAGCSLNTVAMTYMGDVYEPGELLSVNLTTATISAITDRDGNAANNNGTVDYPVTITNASGFTSPGVTSVWTPADDPDHTLETGATAGTDNISPKYTAATATAGAAGAATVALDYSEEILPGSTNVDDYTVTINGAPATVASIADTDGDTVTLTLTQAVAAGNTVVVTAKQGADGNTVLDTATPANEQAVGDSISDVA